MGDTYRRLLTPAQRQSREKELARLEELMEQIVARIDELRAEIYGVENPEWDTDVTPVTIDRYRK